MAETHSIKGADVDRIIREIEGELEYAMQKYPSPNTNVAALAGECGEACEAMNKEPFANVRKECVQVAVMAIRLALEGDPYVDIYRITQGLDLSSSINEVAVLTPPTHGDKNG